MHTTVFMAALLSLLWRVAAAPTTDSSVPAIFDNIAYLAPPAFAPILWNVVPAGTICFWSRQSCKGVNVCYSIPTGDDPKKIIYSMPNSDVQKIQDDGSRSGAASWKMMDRDLDASETIIFYLSAQKNFLPQLQYTKQKIPKGLCNTIMKAKDGANQFTAMTYSKT